MNNTGDDGAMDGLRLRLTAEGSVSFGVRARPGAHRTRAVGMLEDGTLKIDLAAAPEDGEANAELIRFLAGEFGVLRGNVELVSGRTGRRKVVRVVV